MKHNCIILLASLFALMHGACSATKPIAKETTPADTQVTNSPVGETCVAPSRPIAGGVRAMPFAYIYRTNGNYIDNVTISLNPDTGQPVSYPATTDVGEYSDPMVLADGWLLDRRGGVGLNTVFLKWTYSEYHDLPATPAISEILDSVIPGARVTEVRRLDMTTFAAQADTAAVNRIIRAGFEK